MTGLIVVGGVLLVSAFLLCCPVSVEAEFEEEFSARVRYLFVRYRIYPRPEKPEKKEPKEAPPAEKKPSKLRELLRKRGLSGFLELAREFSRIALGGAKKLLSHTVVDRLALDLAVGGDDAAAGALNYGRAGAAVSTARGALLSAAKCKKPRVEVAPDFVGGKSAVHFRVRLKIRLCFLVSSALAALFGFVRLYLKIKKESGHPDQKEKAVS